MSRLIRIYKGLRPHRVRMWTATSNQSVPRDLTESRKIRILRAVAFATWIHSLLFFVYVSLRVAVGNCPLNDPFIYDVPYFTFYVTGMWLLVICFTSMISYIAIRNLSRPRMDVKRKVEEKIPANLH